MSVLGSLVGTRSLLIKVHPEKKKRYQKNSTVRNRGSSSLFLTVKLFFDCSFFPGVHFYRQTPAIYSEFDQGHSTYESVADKSNESHAVPLGHNK
jgi:hypothetical protein